MIRMRTMRLGLNKLPRCMRGRRSRKEAGRRRRRREVRMTRISGNNYLGLVFEHVDRCWMSGRGNIGEPLTDGL